MQEKFVPSLIEIFLRFHSKDTFQYVTPIKNVSPIDLCLLELELQIPNYRQRNKKSKVAQKILEPRTENQ